MSIPRRPQAALAVIAVALSVAVVPPSEAVAAGCNGNAHTMTLSAGSVSPGAGTSGATFRFSVVYTDSGDCPPDRIVVDVVGLGRFALAYVQGDLKAGATFARGVTLSAGSWRYSFTASSGSGPGTRTSTYTSVQPRKVVVTAPPPKPTPKPTPRATPRPAAATPNPGVTHVPPTETPAPSEDHPTSPPATTVATPSPGAVGPVSSRRPDAAATSDDASATTRFQDGGIPRPVLALLVSSFGTLLGLALFAMLAIRLLDRRPLFDVSVARWRGRDDHLGRQGPA